jgi:hypothetical protein
MLVKNNKQTITALLLALISIGIFIAVVNWFLIEREKEQNEMNTITFSGGTDSSNITSTVIPENVIPEIDYTKSSIEIGDGGSVITRMDEVSTTTEYLVAPKLISRLSIVDSKGNIVRELYKYEDLGSYLRIHKLSSDKNRLYFYARPDGLGGYYALDQIFTKKFFVYNFKTDSVSEITVKNSEKLNLNQIDDVSDDGKTVAFTREKTSTSKDDKYRTVVSIYYIKENRTFDLPSWEKEGYTIAGGAKLVGNDKVIYQTAWNNLDDEHIQTVEYDLISKTYKVLKTE